MVTDAEALPEEVREQILTHVRQSLGATEYRKLVGAMGEDAIIKAALQEASATTRVAEKRSKRYKWLKNALQIGGLILGLWVVDALGLGKIVSGILLVITTGTLFLQNLVPLLMSILIGAPLGAVVGLIVGSMVPAIRTAPGAGAGATIGIVIVFAYLASKDS